MKVALFLRAKRLLGTVACAVALSAASATFLFSAHALDYNDVRELVRSKVPDAAIISVVQQTNFTEITDEQAEELRSLGASQELMDVLVAPPLSFDDLRQLITSGVPEAVIINMVLHSRVLPLVEEEENELRELGASEHLLAVLVDPHEPDTANDEPTPGDGAGTIMTLDDLQGGGDFEAVYPDDSYGSTYGMEEPPTIYVSPENYYYDHTPYYGGGILLYPDYGYRHRRHPSRPPPPPPPPPPVRPRPPHPEIRPPRPIGPLKRPHPPGGSRPGHGSRPKPGEGGRPSRPRPPAPVNPGKPGGTGGHKPRPAPARPGRPSPPERPVVTRPPEKRSEPSGGSRRGQGGGGRSSGRAAPGGHFQYPR